ncbi:hypothetical protein WDU94_011115 [Cyamophila willieti]
MNWILNCIYRDFFFSFFCSPESAQPEYSRAQTDPRYVGEKIPSRSFQVLQAITKPFEDMKVSEMIKAPFVPGTD